MYNKYSICIVNYLNTKPFLYGLEKSGLTKVIDLQKDIPSVCAEKLINGVVDIGLVPAAALPKLDNYQILTDYCIGAVGKVDSVKLFSNVPLNEIKNILLDYQSQTSVNLVQILCSEFWKINPLFINTTIGFENSIKDNDAAVIIGDRTFIIQNTYPFEYDLAQEWQKFTGLPFVFAVWASKKKN